MGFVQEAPVSAKAVESFLKGRDEFRSVRSQITTGFILAMFGYVAITRFLGFVFQSGRARGVPLPGLILTTSIDMTRYLVVLLVTAFILQSFWGRLIVHLWMTRHITYQESIAIVLMVGILLHA
jgi:hypothetical protein